MTMTLGCASDASSRAIPPKPTTGWSDATQYDDLDLPDPPSNVIPDTFEEFTGAALRGSAGPRRPSRLLLWLLALSLGLVVARALMALLARA